jgi:hypothetical protein
VLAGGQRVFGLHKAAPVLVCDACLTLGWGLPRVPLAAPAIMARPPVLRRAAGSTQMRTGGNCDELSVRISQAVVGFGAAAALFVSPGIRHALMHAA